MISISSNPGGRFYNRKTNSNIHSVKCSVSACRNEVKQPGTSRFCESHKWKENATRPEKNKPNISSSKVSRGNQNSVISRCEFCGKENVGGRITKGVGKTVGNTTQGVFGTLTMLTGGLTAPLMLGFGMIGAAISGSSEKYRYCAECRRK